MTARTLRWWQPGGPPRPSPASRWAWHLLWLVPTLIAVGIAVWRVADGRASGSTATAAPRIVAFSVAPGQARPGAPVTLAWQVDGAESVRLDPLPGATVPIADQFTIQAPEMSTDFVLTATADGQTLTRTVRLDVTSEPPAILYFEAQPNAIEAGEGALLTWDVVADDVEVTLYPGEGTRLAAEGSIVRFPVASTVYTLVAANAAGQAVAAAAVTVDGAQVAEPPTVTRFAVSPGACDSDQAVIEEPTVRLEWAVAGAERITIEGIVTLGGVAGGLASDGCLSVPAPSVTQVYSLIAVGPGGAAAADATIEVAGTVSEPTRPPPTLPVVMVPVRGSSGRDADPPEGIDSGHLLDAQSMPAEDAASAAPPSVNLFAVSPVRPRLGDEVVVRWAVGGADAVVVRLDPAPPGVPALDTPSGIYRFVATQDVQVRLEASRTGGAVVRRAVAVAVHQPAGQPLTLDIPTARPSLLATGGATGAVALATEAGDVWLFRVGDWSWLGRVAPDPIALAVVDRAVYVVDSGGRLRAIDLADPVAGVRTATNPWQRGPPPVQLGGSCRRVAGVSSLQVAEAEARTTSSVLLVACADPPAVIAMPVDGGSPGVPTWSRLLDGPPVAIALGSPRGTTLAVRYAADGPLGRRIDMLDAATGDVTTLTLPKPVRLAVPSPDGRALVTALAGEPALFVLDPTGTVVRRVGLEEEVRSVSWVSSDPSVNPSSPVAGAVAAPVGGADAAPPPPPPSPGDPAASAVMAPGTVLVSWAEQPGGALVNLAVWADAPVAARIVPQRSLVGLLDNGVALVLAVAEPGRGIAIPWQAAPEAAP